MNRTGHSLGAMEQPGVNGIRGEEGKQSSVEQRWYGRRQLKKDVFQLAFDGSMQCSLAPLRPVTGGISENVVVLVRGFRPIISRYNMTTIAFAALIINSAPRHDCTGKHAVTAEAIVHRCCCWSRFATCFFQP